MNFNNLKDIIQRSMRITDYNSAEQLNELVSKGLLVIELGEPIIVHDEHSSKVEIKRSVKINLKDKEYIESLEKENAKLKEQIKILMNIKKDLDKETK